MTTVAWVAVILAIFLVGTLLLLALAMGCNLELQRRVERANNAAKTARLDARNDRAEAHALRKSNEALRAHTAEHCAKEAALLGLLASQGIQVVGAEVVSSDDADLAYMHTEPNFSVDDITGDLS